MPEECRRAAILAAARAAPKRPRREINTPTGHRGLDRTPGRRNECPGEDANLPLPVRANGPEPCSVCQIPPPGPATGLL